MPQAASPAVLRFGGFLVDVRKRTVCKHGVRLELRGQPFEILLLLLERPGEVISREELQRRLWSSDTFVDFEHGLNVAIKKLRQTLTDSAEMPRYIETVPRVGYRFIARVQPVIEPSDGLSPASGNGTAGPTDTDAVSVVDGQRPGTEKSQSPSRRLPLVAAALVVIAAVLFVLDVGGLRSNLLSHSAAQPQIRSLAVLPLRNLSGDPEQEYFADGMTDELITEVSRLSLLKVISQTSVMQYKGEKKRLVRRIHG